MRPLRTQTVSPPLRGLSLARERECVLAWDGQDGLFVFDRAGRTQARRSSPLPVAVACASEDGRVYAVGSKQSPGICLLTPDLTPRWKRSLPHPATAIALEPFGRCVAVADAGCTLHIFDARGHSIRSMTTPRPLFHLAFVPEKPLLIGAADFGLIVCFDSAGECRWRDGLVAHVGALTLSGDGDCIHLACFGDGLYRYSAAGPPAQRIALEAPCHLAALSYAGDSLLTADREQRVNWRDGEGRLREAIHLEGAVTALALGALGDYGIAGLADGSILWLETGSG